MGANNSKANNTDTINWQGVHTNDMSSTLPNMDRISHDAKQLVSRLSHNVPEMSEGHSEFNANNIFSQLQGGTPSKNNIDDASPFISSEMYNYLVNKYQGNNNMTGGNNMVGGEGEGDSSSTSSTSSSTLSSGDSSSSSSDKKETKKKDTKKSSPKVVSSVEESIKEESPVEESTKEESPVEESLGKKKRGKLSKKKVPKKKVSKKSKKQSYKGNHSDAYLSYVSSSAHTNGSVSLYNENNYSISSVNTSDINMISE